MNDLVPARAVVFDFDGTLADSLAEAIAVYQNLAAGLGLRPISAADVLELRGMRPHEALRAFAIPMWKVPTIMARMRRGLADRIDRLMPFPGMAHAILTLREAGYRSWILSSNSKQNIRDFLARNHMPEFDGISSGSSAFGKAAKLRRLLRQTRWTPAKVCYVGDEVRDVLAAKEAGVRSIAVSWGYSSRQALAAERPGFLVDTPDELLRAVLGLGSDQG